jgi:hypothetical protein
MGQPVRRGQHHQECQGQICASLVAGTVLGARIGEQILRMEMDSQSTASRSGGIGHDPCIFSMSVKLAARQTLIGTPTSGKTSLRRGGQPTS